MIRLIGPVLSFIFRNVFSGAFWALGSAIVGALDHARKEGHIMIRTPKLLFHPKVTFSAYLAGLATLLGYSREIEAAFGQKGLLVVIASAVILSICTYGRSPASAVDNNKP